LDSKKENNINGIKRRSFFKYVGIGLAGFTAVTSFPFKLLGGKLSGRTSSGKITISANPFAVKRKSGVKNNG